MAKIAWIGGFVGIALAGCTVLKPEADCNDCDSGIADVDLAPQPDLIVASAPDLAMDLWMPDGSLPDGSLPIPDLSMLSCYNGIKDGNETDVDCGGNCLAKCGNGQACTANGECGSNICTNGKCAGPVCPGGGTFGPKVDYMTAGVPDSVAAGDLDGDGKLDLAAADYGSMVRVLHNQGGGMFVAMGNYLTGMRPLSVAVGDLNGRRLQRSILIPGQCEARRSQVEPCAVAWMGEGWSHARACDRPLSGGCRVW